MKKKFGIQFQNHSFALAEPLIDSLSTTQLKYVNTNVNYFSAHKIRKRKEDQIKKLEEEMDKMTKKGIQQDEARVSLSMLGGHPSAYRAEGLLAVAFSKV